MAIPVCCTSDEVEDIDSMTPTMTPPLMALTEPFPAVSGYRITRRRSGFITQFVLPRVFGRELNQNTVLPIAWRILTLTGVVASFLFLLL